MTWNWQRDTWPHFSYDRKALESQEARFLRLAGESFGAFKHISEEDKNRLKVDLMSEEAFETSMIEGEMLNRDSIQSSIGNEFGISSDHGRIPLAERGVAAMMVDLYKNFDKPLSHFTLFAWHSMLMNGRRDLVSIGAYRTQADPMQVISGAMHNPRIHFEAPPSFRMAAEMDAFIKFFFESGEGGKRALPALARAGLAHLYFVSIHPFEDGNGRIGRAISEKSLAESLGRPTLIALASTIERNRKAYYENLEYFNKDTEVTGWLIYFAETILEAQDYSRQRIEYIIQKAKFYDRLRGKLNERQQKVIDRIFREGIGGFKGGLSAENYRSITGAPRTTVTRDLNDLVAKGALTKVGRLKYTRYHLNICV